MPNRNFLRPYAALSAIEHFFDVDHLDIYLVFKFPMDQTVKPANAKWICEVNEVEEDVTDSDWQDEFTLWLEVDNIANRPLKVTIEYDGPDSTLRTTWFKQWEPWGPIVSDEIQPAISTKIISGPLVANNADVSNVSVLFFDCTAGNIIIGGFVGGINGQVLEIAKTDNTPANFAALGHAGATGNQDIFLHAGAAEVLTGEYGGWTLVCNGSNWYDVSHAKHV